MSSRRWLVPVGLAAALVAGSVAGPALNAVAEPQLPPLTAAELLERVRTAQVPPLSGSVRSVASLGLPALPAGTPLDLLSGETTSRVWYAGPERVRVAVTDELAERVLVRDGSTVTTYDSRTDEATVVRLPADVGTGTDRTPVAGAAEQALAAIDPSTVVEVGRASRVAGRAAYELRLLPRDPATLIASVALAVDAETSVPLRVQVAARSGAEPAYQVAFTSIDYAAPAAALFRYRPPATAEVTERTLPALPSGPLPTPPAAGGPGPEVIGTAWSSVVVLRGLTADALPPALLEAATPVPGGRLLGSRLLNVLITDDGSVYAGSVTRDALLAARR